MSFRLTIATVKEFYRRHLPHWQPRGAVFFVTFRLKNSLPHDVIEALREQRNWEKIARKQAQLDNAEEHQYFARWDAYLDKAEFGPRWLTQPEIIEVVKEALHYQDGKVLDLHAFCIMSNHVHVVFEPLSTSEWHSGDFGSEWYSDLPKTMPSLKRHSARQSNLVLGREGPFWQDESYDHVIRDAEEHIRIINYVLENPVQARLVSR